MIDLQFEFGSSPWLIKDASVLRSLYLAPADRAPLEAALHEMDPKSLVWGNPERSGRVATIPIHGVLTARPGWWRLFGLGGWSLTEIELAAYQLLSDDTVDDVLLDISSPGGEALPMASVGQAIADLAAEKNVVALVRDIGCSAAYWLASQANQVVIGGTAEAGSIGAVSVVWDWSKLMEESGITVHVVSTGKHKGDFAFGTEVTKEQLADLERVLTAINDRFVAAVASGRNMNEADVRKLADGRVHIGSDAVDLRLVDRVGTTRDVLEQLEAGMPDEIPDNPTIDETESPNASVGGAQGRPTGATEDQPPATAGDADLAARYAALEQRLEQIETRGTQLDAENQRRAIDQSLDALGSRVTPGMRRQGLASALAAASHITVSVGDAEMSVDDIVLQALAALPTSDYLGSDMAADDGADASASVAGMDADRIAYLKLTYPDTFTGRAN